MAISYCIAIDQLKSKVNTSKKLRMSNALWQCAMTLCIVTKTKTYLLYVCELNTQVVVVYQ